ncbi:intraflagellar transport protein 25 homolog [Chanos chanos]|uniref:Intraflagellar transport protein 25 homolog n=1 Tax=Chanos chanos TaxID=29144 RepID=A0A6J2WP76_CHACN|nr:intraflagellar transport protein 25 homolog [Chanos chanos]
MTHTALSSAQVVLASSGDENHPPENISDGNTETFWISTGMFPQEFIMRFPEEVTISALTMHSYNVKSCRIERSTSEEAEKFEAVEEKEFEHTDGHLQTNDISVPGISATHLRFVILSGYDHFVSIHKVSVQ